MSQHFKLMSPHNTKLDVVDCVAKLEISVATFNRFTEETPKNVAT